MTLNPAKNYALVLTPTAPAAIAVVRLLGPAVGAFLAAHFSRPAPPGRCVHGTLLEGSRVIDDPVVVALPDESGADISLHGGSWVVQSLLDLAERNGFQTIGSGGAWADPDFADGNSILEREVAVALPLARTEPALRVLLAQPRAWTEFVAGAPNADQIRDRLADATLQHLLAPSTVAIVGPANVGKSTLANQLFGQERSITADVPGTTRDWVGEIADVAGVPVMLVDTPGLRSTDDQIEQTAIERSRQRVATAELLVLVLDATRPFEPEQSRLLAAYPTAMKVVNKCDQPWAFDPAGLSAIHTVGITGKGIDILRKAIAGYFGCADLDLAKARAWTPRQRKILERAVGDPSLLRDI